MRDATYAPIYVGLYTHLAETARAHGYALAIHGTVTRDLDVVAVPWTTAAVDPFALVHALLETVGCAGELVALVTDGAGRSVLEPVAKPHGRLAWAIPLGCGAVLDLSVMPRARLDDAAT